ncbi:MAG: SulP family inorganic anion transporter [Streptomycetales bacterium]
MTEPFPTRRPVLDLSGDVATPRNPVWAGEDGPARHARGPASRQENRSSTPGRSIIGNQSFTGLRWFAIPVPRPRKRRVIWLVVQQLRGWGRRARPRVRPDPRDVLAGMSVALVLIPQSLAYAEIVGVPIVHGLYASALPPIAAACFASSPYLQTGPVAMTSLLTFGALATLATPKSPEYVQLALLLALVVGVTRLLIGLLRAGTVAYLMSQPMLMGFTPAAATLVVGSQLPTAVGLDRAEGHVLYSALSALTQPANWQPACVAPAIATLVLVLTGPRLHRAFPAVLVAVVAGVSWSVVTGYARPTVGVVPEGFPPFTTSLPWHRLPELAVPGVVIALVGFAEAASISRIFASTHQPRWRADREFVSQGVANVASGLTGGFPVGGSFSRSALNRLSGARTRASGAICGLTVLAFLPFTSALSPLPTAILAAIVIAAVLRLIRLGPLLRLWRYSRSQAVIGWTTFAATLILAPHIEQAVMLGIGLSLANHLLRELSLDIDSSSTSETLHLRPRGVLWFGTTRILEDSFLELLSERPGQRRLVVHLDGLGRIDLSGALAFRGLLQHAREAGLEIVIEDVPPRSRQLVAAVLEQTSDPLGGRAGKDALPASRTTHGRLAMMSI